MPRVREGYEVAIIFRLTTPDGRRIDQALTDAPIRFIYGERRLIGGIEERLRGLRLGEELLIELPADVFGTPGDAWTQAVEPWVKPGMVVWAARAGVELLARVSSITDGRALLLAEDALAGLRCSAWVKVVEIGDDEG